VTPAAARELRDVVERLRHELHGLLPADWRGDSARADVRRLAIIASCLVSEAKRTRRIVDSIPGTA